MLTHWSDRDLLKLAQHPWVQNAVMYAFLLLKACLERAYCDPFQGSNDIESGETMDPEGKSGEAWCILPEIGLGFLVGLLSTLIIWMCACWWCKVHFTPPSKNKLVHQQFKDHLIQLDGKVSVRATLQQAAQSVAALQLPSTTSTAANFLLSNILTAIQSCISTLACTDAEPVVQIMTIEDHTATLHTFGLLLTALVDQMQCIQVSCVFTKTISTNTSEGSHMLARESSLMLGHKTKSSSQRSQTNNGNNNPSSSMTAHGSLQKLPQTGGCKEQLSGNSSVSQRLLYQLWHILIASCKLLTAWQHSCPSDPGCTLAAVYPVLTHMMTLLLDLNCQARQRSKSPHMAGFTLSDTELVEVLSLPTICLEAISNGVTIGDIGQGLDSLPTAFIPLLCCLITGAFEGLDSVCSHQAAQTDVSFLGVLNKQQSLHRQAAHNMDSCPMICSAVKDCMVRVAKVIQKCIGTQMIFEEWNACFLSPPVVRVLKYLLIKWNPQDLILEGEGVKFALSSILNKLMLLERGPSIDDHALTMKLRHIESNATEIDALVLKSLRTYCGDDPAFLGRKLTLTKALFQSWDGSYCFPPISATQRLQCMVCVCRECSTQMSGVLRMLTQHARPELSEPNTMYDGRWTGEIFGDSFIQFLKEVLEDNLQLTRKNKLPPESNEEVLETGRPFIPVVAQQSTSLTIPLEQQLCCWQQLPGTTIMLEASVRNKVVPAFASDMHSYIMMCTQALQLLPTATPSSLHAYCSLGATLHKLLCIYIHAVTKQQQQHLSRMRQPIEHLEEEKRCEFGHLWTYYVTTECCAIVTAMEEVQSSMCTSPVLNAPQSRIGDGLFAPSYLNPLNSRHVAQLRQLQTMLMHSVGQLCHWRVQQTDTGENASLCSPSLWMEHICCEMDTLNASISGQESMSHTPYEKSLQGLVLSELDLPEPSDLKVKAEMGARWERHALAWYDGRLLPGCCSMVCMNVKGWSESVLRTRLCSGCRRVRYCCVECQRNAWKEGGHSLVCCATALE